MSQLEGKIKYKVDNITHLNDLKYTLKFLNDNNVKYMLAGGSCLDAVIKLDKETHDYDIFFETEEEFNRAFDLFNKEVKLNQNPLISEDKDNDIFNMSVSINSYFIMDESTTAVTLQMDGLVIQFIKSFKPFKDTINRFDLNNSKYWSFYPFNIIQTNQPKETLTNISLADDLTFSNASRILKYNVHKNINISDVLDDIYKMLINPRKEHLLQPLYKSEDTGRKYSDLNSVHSSAIYNFINIEEFRQIILKKEQEGHLFPYHKIEPHHFFDPSIKPKTELPILNYYRSKVEGQEISDKDYDYILKTFPEILL